MKLYRLLFITALLGIAVSCDDDDDDGGTATDVVNLDLVADGFVSPVSLTEAPDNSGRLFVVDQPGQIYIIKDGNRLPEPFLNIQNKLVPLQGSSDERGLLGLAFHPQYASNGKFYVFYSGPKRESAFDHTNYVAEYKVSVASADRADVASERIVLAMDHPQANHNAGMVGFGDDGYLYISVGDGGGGGDKDAGHVDDWYADNAGGNGQDITQNLLGSILRIDVSPETGYAIPADNPFVNAEGMDEIYAYGLRNPYRFSFDPSGKVILADAGQNLYEEINLVEKGGNYGWNVKEGTHCFDAANFDVPKGSCPSADANGKPLLDPVIEFKNSRSASDGLGTVSIGGYVYEGDEIGSLNGRYLFGVLTQEPDAVNGAIYSANRSGNTWSYDKLKIANHANQELGQFLLGFGQDEDGEVYALTVEASANSGKVYKIIK